MKALMQPGERGELCKIRYKCVEIAPFTTGACAYCDLKGSDACTFMLCFPDDRPDGKRVIFKVQCRLTYKKSKK